MYNHPPEGGVKTKTKMSDLRINIRLLMWHFQVTDNWKCRWTYNDYHKGLKHGWFKVCEFKPFKKNLNRDCAGCGAGSVKEDKK